MKKLILFIFMFPLLINMSFAETTSAVSTSKNLTAKELKKAEARQLVGRLHEIRDLVKSKHPGSLEKKQLRQEVKDIQHRLEKMDGVYVYLSATAILIILLLIILL
jgi:hypothetical protein